MLVLLAQALEVLSDVFISAFLLLALFWSRKPADELHTFGHGRAQNVAGLVSATVLVLFMSVETLREAVPRLFQAESTLSQDTNLALLVTTASMVIVAVPIMDILRVKQRGASVRAQLVSLLKDEAPYVIASAAIILVAQGYVKADPLASTKEVHEKVSKETGCQHCVIHVEPVDDAHASHGRAEPDLAARADS